MHLCFESALERDEVLRPNHSVSQVEAFVREKCHLIADNSIAKLRQFDLDPLLLLLHLGIQLKPEKLFLAIELHLVVSPLLRMVLFYFSGFDLLFVAQLAYFVLIFYHFVYAFYSSLHVYFIGTNLSFRDPNSEIIVYKFFHPPRSITLFILLLSLILYLFLLISSFEKC